jgi:hypothetical protein
MGKVKTATNVYTGEKVGLARGIAWLEVDGERRSDS